MGALRTVFKCDASDAPFLIKCDASDAPFLIWKAPGGTFGGAALVCVVGFDAINVAPFSK